MAENKPKEVRLQQIMNAAMQVFVKKGYSQTRMTDIVQQSGLSKGAIYHHFKSKRDLFLALIDHWESYSFPDYYQYVEDGKPASQILNEFSSEVVRQFRKNPTIFLAELEFWSMANRDTEVLSKVKFLYGHILALFERVIQRGIDQGEFKKLDPKVTALSIMTSLQGITWFTIFESESFKGEEYLRHVMEFIIYGIKKN